VIVIALVDASRSSESQGSHHGDVQKLLFLVSENLHHDLLAIFDKNGRFYYSLAGHLVQNLRSPLSRQVHSVLSFMDYVIDVSPANFDMTLVGS
jgi:hypothetical protein